MKTLSGPVSTEAAAAQSGWCELVDLYLKATIATPAGSTNILRLCTLPGGFSFFTPKIAPEPAFGTAADYLFWPMRRATVKMDANYTTDKLTITASNVSTEWAQMLEAVDWYDVPVIVRKAPITLGTVTADDCAVIFSGFVDSAKITDEQVQLTCSNDFSSFNTKKPSALMHHNCRFQWGDDMCTALRFAAANCKVKTVAAGSTTKIVNSADLTEDGGLRASLGIDQVDGLASGAFTASSASTGFEAEKVRASVAGSWRFDEVWGVIFQNAYRIPDAQAGLKNPLLQPYIQIDFGSNKSLKHWRIKNNATTIEQIARLILFFSSTDASNWKFEQYHECQPILGGTDVINIHGAASARYWRICIRSRWMESNNYRSDFENIEAYITSRNYWANGTITFAADTLTTALRGISRRVLESYNGEISVMALPVAPAAGDTFTIERGCPRSFNGCAERQNTENYGGFDSLPNETVVR